MRGLPFNLIERYLLERHGETVLERVLCHSGFAEAEPWVGALTYPDRDFHRLVGAAAEVLEVRPEALLEQAARAAAPYLMQRYFALVAGLDSPLSLIDGFGVNVLPQIKRMWGGNAYFDAELIGSDEDGATIRLKAGPRMQAAFAGLLSGLADHFGTPAQVLCTPEAANEDACEIRVLMTAEASA